MIQKILDAVSNLNGAYTDIVETEKILKILLTSMVVSKIFEIRVDGDTVTFQQDASVFMNYLNEQLDLYIEDKDVKLFLFSTVAVYYFLDSKRIFDSYQFQLLFSNDNEDFYSKIRTMVKAELVECLRKTELFFKGVENEKV